MALDPQPLGDVECQDFIMDPPPASADSGHPASVYNSSRHSPTLFSDPFKLDIDIRPS